jgi:putative tricarboxylic transport membrane protein
MGRRDQASSLFWLLFALCICGASLRMPLGTFRDPGPAFLPLGSGILLGILSVICFLKANRLPKIETKGAWICEHWRSLILVLGVLTAYAFTLEFLGFIIATFLLMVILFRGIEPQKWIVALGGGALTSLLSYAVFEVWLKTQLPKGFLGF